jgi:iron(III) transport system ATP-binding protein
VVMNKGVIEQVGPPHEVYSRPHTRFVADFIGRANFIDARVVDTHDHHLTVEAFGRPISVEQAAIPVSTGSPVTLVLRPEAMRVGAPGGLWDGTVRRATYLGNAVDYEIEIAGQPLVIQDTDPRRPTVFAEGQSVSVTPLESCVHVLE